MKRTFEVELDKEKGEIELERYSVYLVEEEEERKGKVWFFVASAVFEIGI